MTDHPQDPQCAGPAAMAFAAAVDAGDFSTAANLLAPDCEYRAPGVTLRGRDVVIQRLAADWNALGAEYDDVRRDSELELDSGDAATLLRTEYLVKAGGGFERRRYRWEITVDVARQVVRVVNWGADDLK